MNTAIIVAAGTGSRFSSDQPKQFTHILGRPLLVHTLQRFEACPDVDEIVLVLSEAGREQFQNSNLGSEISKLRSVVAGGSTRAESVKNGLDVIDAATANVVAVHDGARPLVSVREITQTIQKADEAGAACLVAEVTDTIKEISEGVIVSTVDRNKLRRALTPQAFRHDILVRAFANADLGDNVTDECYLVEKLGISISIVEGSSRNIKITRPEDLRLAEIFLTDV